LADVFTNQATLDYSQNAYDLMAYPALRPELYFDGFADVKATRQAMAGKAVIFTIQSDLAAATTALNESTDISAVAMADTQVTLTLVEYGNAVITSAFLRGTTFLALDPITAGVIGFNAGLSIDTVARDVLKAGTNVRYAASGAPGPPVSRATVTPANILQSNDVRRALADLRGGNVATIGGNYVAVIHPDVAYDLRGQATGAGWRDPHTYSQPSEIWNGEVGTFENFKFIETPRAPLFVDAGSSATTTDVYRTMFFGRQALAKAYSYTDGNGPYPKVVPGPVVDHLRRFVPWGWYWLGTYGIFRQTALRAVESASSIGAN